jgi:hypothetical protein
MRAMMYSPDTEGGTDINQVPLETSNIPERAVFVEPDEIHQLPAEKHHETSFLKGKNILPDTVPKIQYKADVDERVVKALMGVGLSADLAREAMHSMSLEGIVWLALDKRPGVVFTSVVKALMGVGLSADLAREAMHSMSLEGIVWLALDKRAGVVSTSAEMASVMQEDKPQ